jgi:hypothetical protein
LVADEFDKLWDDSITSLTFGYAATLESLQKDAPKDALGIFHTQCVPPALKIAEKMAGVYPKRFSKIEDWCSWASDLKTQTEEAEKLLTPLPKKDSKEWKAAVAQVEKVRGEFCDLHEKSQTQTTSDFIYALREEIHKDKINVEALQKIRSALETAHGSTKAKANAEEYVNALARWDRIGQPVLKWKGNIPPSTLSRLRQTTDAFYAKFGADLE